MAANVTVIGPTARVRGRLSGVANLEVLGFVEGEITVDGDVTVDSHGMVGANVHGRRVVVRGAVRGDLVAAEAIVLEEGARVVGDVTAPRIAIAEGAFLRGQIQTADENAPETSSGRAQVVSRPQSSAAVRVSSAPQKERAVVAAAPKPVPKVEGPALTPVNPIRLPSPANNAPAPRRPPPPVVPAMKKLKGQMLKKKER